MDNQRLFIWMAFGLLLWLSFQSWQRDYGPPPPPPAENVIPGEQESGDTDFLPAAPSVEEGEDLPSLATTPASVPATPAKGRIIRVVTDVLDVEINTVGGELQGATLLGYPVRKDDPDNLVRLLDASIDKHAVIRSGLRAAKGAAQPTHQAEYEASQFEYRLADGQSDLSVTLNWFDPTGITAKKTYTFKRGRYDIGLSQEIQNGSSETWSGASYVQIEGRNVEHERSMFDVETLSFDGPVFFDGKKYEKLDLGDLTEEPIDATIANGWLAAIKHHFVFAVVPKAGEINRYTIATHNRYYLATAMGPIESAAPGGSTVFTDTFFVGPKLQDQLAEVADGLKLTVDYGFLTVVSGPLFWLLNKIHDFVGNWGWSIIFLTIFIKLLLYKLNEKSGRSMAKMKKLQPRLKAIQERYKDDRQKLNEAMMDLYKREKANPLGGCLPILVQMPVFLALYWVLLESVEMRQAPFMLWLNDLSSRDPYFVLPLLMGITMWAQQKLNPAPPDPIQARVMMVLPIMFTVFFAFFPSGLVLYWFVNSLLSIAQQWKINKAVEAEKR